MTKQVYLAGPEVFLVNAREILDEKIALTREAGLMPVSPGDAAEDRQRPAARPGTQPHRRAPDGFGRRDHRQPDAVPRHRR